MNFATAQDVIDLWRPLEPNEIPRVEALLPIISDSLRLEAEKVGKDLDMMMSSSPTYTNVLKSVTVDVVARTLMTATDKEPMVQFSESALGYSQSGTFLSPGGGLFIKNSELARLGLRRQGYGTIEPYGTDYGGWPYGES